MELLARRRRVALAEQGRDLLEEKRSALLRELRKMVDSALQEGEALDRAAATAREALDLACARDGPEAVRSAGFAAGATGNRFAVAVEGASVMGVPVPIVALEQPRRGMLDRGYSPAFSSARLDRVGESFEEELRCLVRLAEADVRIRRVGEEIRRTGRRVNALRQVVLPDLAREVRRIAAALEEQEREDHARLKHLKRTRTLSVSSRTGR
jgi:V/A-type H+-transporting ATPase subunit D